jgi:hypothetical protein
MTATGRIARQMSTVAALLAVVAATAQPMAPLPGVNLALGKPVRFSIEPNYTLCKGGDETDLTDGKYWQPDNPAKYGFWGDTGTVGWSWGGSDQTPGALITVDLGEVSAISAVGFDTTAGASQVTFPGAVLLYVSDDGQAWQYATDLINEAVPQNTFIRHRFVAQDLNSRGRYVGVYVVKGGFYAFVDEIEVMGGGHDPGSVRFASPPVALEALNADAGARARAATQKNTSLYLIRSARDLKPDAATAKALAGLQQHAVAMTEVERVDFSRGLPYTTLDEAVCRTMGAYYQRRQSGPLTVWAPQPTLWSNTTPFARPTRPSAIKLHADMMVGEREPVAFNVSNNTPRPLRVRVSVAGPTGWIAANLEKRITTHVLSSGFLFSDDALTPFADRAVTIPPGTTRQVWLILNSRGAAAGNHRATVTVQAAGRTQTLPLTATVYPVEMPARPQYLSQGWGYFDWKPAAGFEREAAAEMERAYETAQVLHHPYIPWPKVDPETRQLVRPITVDFTKLDEMLAYRPYVRQWLLWTGFEFGYMSLNYRQANDVPAVGTPEHDAIFREWVRQIRDHLAEKGFTTNDWAFYWVDEPGDDSFLKVIVPASKLAKEVDPTILIWEDHQVSLEALEEYPDAIDIHCCPRSYYRNHPEILAHVLAEKHPSALYECASSKASDPHTYYRLHHLSAVDLGLDGAGMWVWGDSGGQFSDFDGPHTSYGMVYATDKGPITGKRREAWREGIEDVELFRHLRVLAAGTGDARLRALHDESLKQALRAEGEYGQNYGTVEDLMAIRLKVLRTLAAAGG